MNLKELLDECLFGKKPKKKKSEKKTSIKKEEKDEFIEKAIKNITKSSTKKKLDEAREVKFGEHFWWVKKNGFYGLATLSPGAKYISDNPEVAYAGLAKAILTGEKPDEIYKDFKSADVVYSKPILINWLIPKEQIKESGAKDYLDFISKNNLPYSIVPDERVVKKIQEIMKKTLKSLTPEDQEVDAEVMKEAEKQLLDKLVVLPIDLENKKLTKTELSKVKKMMAKGTTMTTKYAEANISPTIKQEDIPELLEMAKKKLG